MRRNFSMGYGVCCEKKIHFETDHSLFRFRGIIRFTQILLHNICVKQITPRKQIMRYSVSKRTFLHNRPLSTFPPREVAWNSCWQLKTVWCGIHATFYRAFVCCKKLLIRNINNVIPIFGAADQHFHSESCSFKGTLFANLKWMSDCCRISEEVFSLGRPLVPKVL